MVPHLQEGKCTQLQTLDVAKLCL